MTRWRWLSKITWTSPFHATTSTSPTPTYCAPTRAANTLGVSLGLLQGTPGGNAGGLGGTDRLGPRRHQRERNGRRRRRRVRLGHQHSGGRAADHQLRSGGHRFVAVRSQQYSVLQHFCPTQHHPEHHHRGFFLSAGLQVGLRPARWDLTTPAAPPIRRLPR